LRDILFHDVYNYSIEIVNNVYTNLHKVVSLTRANETLQLVRTVFLRGP